MTDEFNVGEIYCNKKSVCRFDYVFLEPNWEKLNLQAAELLCKVNNKEELSNKDYLFAMFWICNDTDYVNDAWEKGRKLAMDELYNTMITGSPIETKISLLGDIKPQLKKDLENLAGEIYSQNLKGD